MDNKELFKDIRWKKYQKVKVLKTKIELTDDDKKKAEEFRKFIDEKEDTKKK